MSEEVYLCSECGKCLISSDNFKRHLSEVHENTTYVCEDCGKRFNKLFNLQRHQTAHDIMSGNFLCEKCGKAFHRKDNYENHVNSCDSKKHFQCPLCEVRNSKEVLSKHFTSHHGIRMCTESKKFKSFKDFQAWKDQYEKEKLSHYTKGAKYTRQDGSQFYQYFCHRDGHFHPKGSNIRNIKLIGSNKINGWCPSAIKANLNKEGEVSVTFLKTHVGHDTDLRRLRLTKDDKDDIAKKINDGVPYKTILNEVKDSVPNNSLDRIHLLSQVDIENIRKEYSLKAKKLSEKNTVKKIKGKVARNNSKMVNMSGLNLEAWVEERANRDSVKYFKALNSNSSEYPQLPFDRYFLLIMSKPQMDLLKRFGERFVCIDRQNGENFELVSLLVLDDTDQSFPCAFLFTNKTDTDTMEVFFTEIKNVVGTVHTNLLMTGRENVVGNAWNKVMGLPEKRLFCSWDVYRDWKVNMCMMTDKLKQQRIYKPLQNLMEETDINTFTNMFELIICDLYGDPETTDFASYIVDNYSETLGTWGPCFRANEGIPVNFQLENMHSTLRHILQASTTKRIDKAVNAILTFIRSKIYDRLLLLSKGKVSAKLSELRHRHKVAEKLTYNIINYGDHWCVTSRKKERNQVKAANRDCECQLKCSVCNVCTHAYTCTCFDSTVKLNMCRHIHSVCINEASGDVTYSATDSCSDLDMAGDKKTFDFSTFDSEQDYIIVEQSLSEESETEGETVNEVTEVSIVDHDPEQVMELIFVDDCCTEEVLTFEESLLRPTETAESKKLDLENRFKTILNHVENEVQLEEVEKVVAALQNKINYLDSSSIENSKKRLCEEGSFEDLNLEIVKVVNYPSSIKKPRN